VSIQESGVRQRTVAKAQILLDALPYIREHWGKTVVVKLGGAAMTEPDLAASFAEDVALLRLAGVRPVVVHGGGPQITEVAGRLGLATRFERGLRVTDPDTLDVTRMVLVGRINTHLVSLINRQGVPAAGLSGDDGSLFVAAPKAADLGLVGEIVEVNVGVVHGMMDGFVPVVASTAADAAGQAYNVNADEAAAALAVALGAEKLIYLTDVPGLYDAVDGVPELLSELSVEQCRRLLGEGVVGGGMIPKVEGVIRAMDAGVGRSHILDGRVRHALILELFTPEGLGTMITAEGPEVPRAEDA
jgi:acetylglutamate kinase